MSETDGQTPPVAMRKNLPSFGDTAKNILKVEGTFWNGNKIEKERKK